MQTTSPKLKLTHCSLATMKELFMFKKQDLKLDTFPGYTQDQWGIKAHNRPWIVENGNFKKGMRALEVGGAYSTLPKYIEKKFGVESWIGDDFGEYNKQSELWARWGNPKKLPKKNKPVKYVFEPLGIYSNKYPSSYFDIVFSVSTLEHIDKKYHVDIFKDMNRLLKPGGTQLHTIDVTTYQPAVFSWSITENVPILRNFGIFESQILHWVNVLKKAGIKIETSIPKTINLIKRSLLVESPDVVFKFYPPNNEVKPYRPSASLLLTIESDAK